MATDRVTRDNVNERGTRSDCCGARIEVVYKSIRSNGEMIVWRCGKCETGYVIQSEGVVAPQKEISVPNAYQTNPGDENY